MTGRPLPGLGVGHDPTNVKAMCLGESFSNRPDFSHKGVFHLRVYSPNNHHWCVIS